MNPNAIIYARVSTKRQKEKGYSLGFQEKEARRYAEHNGLTITGVFKDDVSGTTRLDEREGGRQVLALAEQGKMDVLLVWRMDRLSRPPEEEYSRLLTTIELLRRHGVTVWDCESGAIGTSMESIMIAFFKGLAASKEREAITKRSIQGRIAKAESGKWVGQGFPPYGFKKVGKGRDARLAIEEEAAAVVRRIFDLYIGKSGKPMSLHAIATLLTNEGVRTPGHWRRDGSKYWNYRHIGRRLLRKRAYVGEFKYRDVTLNFPELAIVDNTTFDLAQKRLKRNAKKYPKRRKYQYLMSSRVKCTCGSLLGGFGCNVKLAGGGTNTHLYYRCKRQHRHAAGHGCNEGNKRVDSIDPYVWKWVVNLISSDARLEKVVGAMAAESAEKTGPAKAELATVDDMLKDAQKGIHRLMGDFRESESPAIQKALKREIKESGQLIDALERQKSHLEGVISLGEFTPEMREMIRQRAKEARKYRDRLLDGGKHEDREAIIEALDVQGELFYEGKELKMSISAGIKNLVDVICLNGHSCVKMSKMTNHNLSRLAEIIPIGC